MGASRLGESASEEEEPIGGLEKYTFFGIRRTSACGQAEERGKG